VKKTVVSAAMALGVVAVINGPPASASNILPTKAPPPAVSPETPSACSSFSDFITTSCPLSWYGITVYGIIDAGVGWQSHGAPFNGTSSVSETYIISKYSNGAHWGIAANGLSQSNIGIKGNEQFAPGWNFIFDVQAGFDPYSLRFADGPGSVAQNGGVPLTNQTTNADSSRAGQFFNSLGYVGVSSPTFGTLTFFRQNALTLDGVVAYDPLGASYAFSAIGYQGMTCGVGDTEDCRFSTSAKYRLNIGQFRVAALWQFGGYGQNNASNGAYQFQVGADIPQLANGTLSVDAIYSHVKDAVSIGLAGNKLDAAGNPLPPFLPQVLTATISDDTSVMLLARYTNGPLKLYGGYEWIQFAPPSDRQTAFNNISGDFICLGCAAINNTNINNTAFMAHDRTALASPIAQQPRSPLVAAPKTPFLSLPIGSLPRNSTPTPGSCTRKSIMDWRAGSSIAAPSILPSVFVSNSEGLQTSGWP
jgi:predicted porin